jgi:hypothetical protein
MKPFCISLSLLVYIIIMKGNYLCILHVYVVVLYPTTISPCNNNKKTKTVPQVEIRGAPDIYVMAGSGVALHCVISGLIETPPYIFWYHKTERIAGSALEESRMFESSKEAAALASSGLYNFSIFI